MFDGNHRSGRRQVNLGGNKRRGRTSTRLPASDHAHFNRNSVGSMPGFVAAAETGRESLLEQTRILREERRRHQLEEKSATKIQKVYRGWNSRKFVAQNVLVNLWNKRAQQQVSLQQESFLLSLRLSPPLLSTLMTTTKSPPVEDWLVEHAASIQQQQQSSTTTPYALPFRIVQAALSCLRPLQNSTSVTEDNRLQVFFGILSYYLKSETTTPQLWKRIGGAHGLTMLLQSTQECLWWHANNNNNNSNNTNMLAKNMWQWSCQAVKELPKDSPLQRPTQALLAATVMGHHTGVTAKDSSFVWWCYYGTDTTALYEPYFASLVQHVVTRSDKQEEGNNGDHTMTTTDATTTAVNTTTTDQAEEEEMTELSTVLAHVLHRRWHIVLSNALDWQQAVTHKHQQESLPSTALLQFLHHVLTHHNELAILTSLVARGDDVKSLILQQQQQQHLENAAGTAESHHHHHQEDDDDDDSSLDEEMEEQLAPLDGPVMDSNNNNNKTAAAKKDHTKYRKLSKQDLQTMPQLEKTYQEEMQRQKNQIIAMLREHSNSSNNNAAKAYAQSLVEMAVQIGNPSLWISWGRMVLPGSSGEQNTTAMNGIAAAAAQPRRVYVQLLARVLQSATGLRARTSASSPFLSQLAFAGGGEMIEHLWLAALEEENSGGRREGSSSQDALTCTIMTVFCDIFAHSLIALSDDKFLQQYTNVGSAAAAASAPLKKKVMAEQVIGFLRNLLHEVYWVKPVVLNDVKLASSGATMTNQDDSLRCIRARLLLSGTKLWGSLYERWCRLVRSTPFCDESSWWFPHLASQDGENAVVNAARRRSNNGIIDMMDVEESDDDEDDDAMDLSQSDNNAQPEAMETADQENDALANAFRDPKMARILTCIPQALPFDRRVRMFDALLGADKLKTQDENSEIRRAMISMMRGEEATGSARERVEIRRDRLYDDSMRQLNQLGPKLKKRIQVSFVNQHGTQEAGIDGGGVFKEFVDDLIKDAFSLDTKDGSASGSPRLFTVTPLQTLTVNSSLTDRMDLLPHYEFLGRVLGKSVYESILVEPQFCLPFLNQLLGKRNSLEDLKNFDMEYYQNLTKLLSLKDQEIADLGLTFELTLGDGSAVRTVELLPRGRFKQVTKQNVIQYVHLVAHQRLNVQGSVQTRSFLRGFRDLIPAAWVRLFSAYELQKLISGDDSLQGFDVASLKRSMQYAAGYHPSQPIMQWFWEVLEEFEPERQRKFLRFMTSVSRQPLLGFDSLDPVPCVQQIRLPDHIFEEEYSEVVKKVPLPTSSTCMNLLKLPNYRSKELLRKKLLDAIESGAGFELT